MVFPRRWWRLRDIIRAAGRGAFTGPVERRLELSTKVKLVRRAPPSVACYLIVLLARHDAPSWSRFLRSPFTLPLIPPLCCCSFVRTLVLLRHRYFSPPLSFLQHLLASCARPSSFALPRFNSCSAKPPNSPVNRPREATIVKPPLVEYCGILSACCFVATATKARRYKGVVFL